MATKYKQNHELKPKDSVYSVSSEGHIATYVAGSILQRDTLVTINKFGSEYNGEASASRFRAVRGTDILFTDIRSACTQSVENAKEFVAIRQKELGAALKAYNEAYENLVKFSVEKEKQFNL